MLRKLQICLVLGFTMNNSVFVFCENSTNISELIIKEYKLSTSNLSEITIPKIDFYQSSKYFDETRIFYLDIFSQWNIADILETIQELYYENLQNYFSEYSFLIQLEYKIRINVFLNAVKNDTLRENGFADYTLQQLSVKSYHFAKDYLYYHTNLPSKKREELMDIILLSFALEGKTTDLHIKNSIKDLMTELLSIKSEPSIRKQIAQLIELI